MIDDFDVEDVSHRQIETAEQAGLPSDLLQHENMEDAEFEG